MTAFQLTHVALVGARPESFLPLGFHARSELVMQRVVPDLGGRTLQSLPAAEARQLLSAQLPIWVHNAISAPGFPLRDQLQMALRRFEGELRDSRDNEVIASVLSAGFRDRQLDPLALPESMPLRQRCSLLMQIDVWQDAYRRLEEDFVEALLAGAPLLDQWLATPQEDLEPARTG